MTIFGLNNLPKRVAQNLINRIDELDESNIADADRGNKKHIKFESDEFENYEVAKKADEKLQDQFNKLYKQGDLCWHDSWDECVEIKSYQQAAGLTIFNCSADISGGELVMVCGECNVVIGVIKEASVTGE